MKTALVTLKSASPYSQSRPHTEPHLDKESEDAYDRRTWREHLHCDPSGIVVVTAQTWKNMLDDAALFLGMKVKGKGQSTYTKHFGSGIMVLQDSPLGIRKEDVLSERLFLNADGKRGGNRRVWRTYPVIHSWLCDAEFIVTDDTITEAVFEEHIVAAGKYIGIGRWRPRNRGSYGRFEVVKVTWN